MTARRHYLGVTVLCMLGLLVPRAATAQEALQLNDVVELALHSPRVQLAEIQLAQALEAGDRAHAPFSAELRGGYTQDFSSNGATGSPDPFVLSATLNVIESGPLAEQRAGVRRQLTEAEWAVRDAQAQAVRDAARLYLQAVRAGQELGLAEQRAELALLGVEASALDVEAGVANETQLATARLQFEQALAGIDAAISLEVQALSALSTMVGAVITGVVLPADGAVEWCSPDVAVFDPALRLDVFRARHDVDAAQEALARAERDVLPAASFRLAGRATGDSSSVSASADLSTRAPQPVFSLSFDPDPPGTQSQGTSLSVGVNVVVPLDGRVGAAIRTAELALEHAQLQHEIVVQQAHQDAATANHSALNARRDAELATMALAAAEERRRVSVQRLELGLVNELDLLQVDIDLLSAELTLGRANDAALLAALDLNIALGLDPTACLQSAGASAP